MDQFLKIEVTTSQIKYEFDHMLKNVSEEILINICNRWMKKILQSNHLLYFVNEAIESLEK